MATIDDVLKTDIAFSDDLTVSATGDIETVTGLANLRNAVLRRLLTVPGTLVHRPTYGCGVLALQNAPMTLAVKRQLASKIAEQLPLDPRVVKVLGVSVVSEDATPDKVMITVKVEAVGIGQTTFVFEPFSEVTV